MIPRIDQVTSSRSAMTEKIEASELNGTRLHLFLDKVSTAASEAMYTAALEGSWWEGD